jgi:hypothetical protein
MYTKSGDHMFGNVFGPLGSIMSGHHTVGAVQTPGATMLGSGQVSQSAQNMLNGYNGQTAAAQSWQAQQQLAYNQALMAQQRPPKAWMIAGKAMDFDEFLTTLCPEEDDPMRTFLTLKYKGIK